MTYLYIHTSTRVKTLASATQLPAGTTQLQAGVAQLQSSMAQLHCTVEPRLSGPRLSERSIIRTRHNAVYTFK